MTVRGQSYESLNLCHHTQFLPRSQNELGKFAPTKLDGTSITIYPEIYSSLPLMKLRNNG